MAISKNQVLAPGMFYPITDKKIIFQCQVNDTKGFLKNISLFSILIGIFGFFFMQWSAIFVVILSWPILMVWLLPQHYRYIQLEKYSIIHGSGSIRSILSKKKLLSLDKHKFDDIHFIKFDRWEKKKRGGGKDSFGRIEIKINNDTPFFEILIDSTDLVRLVKIFEKHKFQTKVHRKISSGELMIIFPNSPRFQQI
ncbi:MAG: hypothetical protein ACW964_08480 [Candidatus Hodarchaeales archaeon]|jgi:hypothetical protein